MSITLEQLKEALISLDVDTNNVDTAINVLRDLQKDLDNVEVKGRQNVDTLLGCMMAIDSIVGQREVN